MTDRERQQLEALRDAAVEQGTLSAAASWIEHQLEADDRMRGRSSTAGYWPRRRVVS